MKKYTGIIIVTGIIVCVILVGVFKRNKESASEVMDTPTAETAQMSDESTEEGTIGEDEYFSQIQQDIDFAKNKNVFTIQDGKQSYGGFMYEIKNFEIYDSLSEFQSADLYDEDFVFFEPAEPGDEITVVYIELEITNESETATQVFHPANLKAAYADQNGEVNMASEVFYSSPAEHPADEKNPNAPKLEPGASDTLQIAMACECYTDNGELVACSKLYDGSWYLVIPSASYAPIEPPYSIYDDSQHIFIRLEE